MTCAFRRPAPFKLGCWVSIGFGLLWQAVHGWAAEPVDTTGATVEETRVQQIFYVDAGNGEAVDDEKHGTADAPYATISFACRMAEKAKDENRGVKVLIAAGTYREAVEIHPPANGKPDTDAPLVIEAVEHDQTVIDGADTEGWTPSTWKEEAGRWTHPWPNRKMAEMPHATRRDTHDKTSATPPNPAYECGKLLIVNDDVLREVNTPTDLQPGTFWVQWAAPTPVPSGHGAPSSTPEGNSGSSVIVFPPEDVPLRSAIIQVGARPTGLMIDSRRNVVVRGMLVAHTVNSGKASVGLNISRCTNVLIEDVLSQWNDGDGMVIDRDRNVTLRKVRILHNGMTGEAVVDGHNVLAEDCEASFNNFRGGWAGIIDPFRPAGIVAQQVTGSTWRRQRVISNMGRGLWFAEDTNLGIEEAVVRDNVVSGLLLDGSSGPTLISRSMVAGTTMRIGTNEVGAEPAAVSIEACPDVTFEGNVITANGVPAFGLRDSVPGTAPFAARKSGTGAILRAERHTFHHNIVAGKYDYQILTDWPTADRMGPLDFTRYYATLTLDENCFWNPEAAEVFRTYDKAGMRHPGMSFDAWMAFLAARAGGGTGKLVLKSTWQDPMFADPTEDDYRLKEDSPVKDWNLLVDENSAGQ